MARPLKSGVDYFPLDVVLDDSMELIEAEFGMTGFAVVVKLWQKIYRENGYYCEWTDEVALLFKRKEGLSGNVVSEIVSASIKRGIFDRELFDKYKILTSKGIQSRYFEMVARRNVVEVKRQYLLVNVNPKIKIVYINQQNVNNNFKNADNNPQSKGNKSKGNKSKQKLLPEIPAELSEWWKAFVEMRTKVKKPLTEHAKKLNYSKLMELSNGDIKTANAILQQSVMNSWQGLYPLKESDSFSKDKKTEQTDSSYDLSAFERKALNLKYKSSEGDS